MSAEVFVGNHSVSPCSGLIALIEEGFDGVIGYLPGLATNHSKANFSGRSAGYSTQWVCWLQLLDGLTAKALIPSAGFSTQQVCRLQHSVGLLATALSLSAASTLSWSVGYSTQLVCWLQHLVCLLTTALQHSVNLFSLNSFTHRHPALAWRLRRRPPRCRSA